MMPFSIINSGMKPFDDIVNHIWYKFYITITFWKWIIVSTAVVGGYIWLLTKFYNKIDIKTRKWYVKSFYYSLGAISLMFVIVLWLIFIFLCKFIYAFFKITWKILIYVVEGVIIGIIGGIAIGLGIKGSE